MKGGPVPSLNLKYINQSSGTYYTNIILPTATCIREVYIQCSTPVTNLRSRNELQGAWGVLGWDGKNNESMHERFGMGVTTRVVDCELVK